MTAATAAVLAAARTIDGSRRRRALQVRRKGLGDFVTDLDLRCERQLRTQLLAAVPDSGFLGEETAVADLQRQAVWVVDPIDGTSNFANGLPHWAIAVALLWQRRPVVAAMWSMPEGALYSAVLGHGARRNGRRLSPRRERWDDGSIVGCQWHRGQQQLAFLAAVQRDGARVRTFGSSVVQLIDVACGRLDANVQQQGRVWDVAAPALLLTEAGGRLTDWRGRDVFPLRRLDIGHTATIGARPRVLRALVRHLRAQPDPNG